MTGTIECLCPEMLTTRVSWTERRTSQIRAATFVHLDNGRTLTGQLTFPVCSIRKKFFILWQVDQVTAIGDIGFVTLAPEWTLGPLAFPCSAKGKIYGSEFNREGKIDMTFPFAWAWPSGPKEWTVEAVIGRGIVTF